MDYSIVDLYTAGLSHVLQWNTLYMLLLGVVSGVIIGAMPGLSATMAVAVMTPLTYNMDTGSSYGLLMGVFCGAVYGGSITAVVANIPGTPAAIMTMLDGHPMAKQGKAGLAIGVATIASVIGGLFSVVILSITAFPLAKAALAFSAQEYFGVSLIGLSVIAIISEASIVRGLISGIIGLLLAAIGSDPMTGALRFTFGSAYLLDGLEMVPVLIGFFGLVSCFEMSEKTTEEITVIKEIGNVFPTWKEFKRLLPTIARGSVIGTIIGAIPAAGGTIASIVAYGTEKRIAKNPEEYGKGEMRGIAAPESANNAVTGGAMIPMLALGVPGDAATAILLGALTINGLTAGPLLFTEHMDVVSSIFILLAMSNILFFFVGIFGGAKVISRIITVPREYIVPLILMFCIVGAFASRSATFDIWSLLVIGLIGYIFSKVNLPASPAVLGFVLGDLFETGFRRGMMLSHGNFLDFFTRPISGVCIAISIVIVFLPCIATLIGGFLARKDKSGASY